MEFQECKLHGLQRQFSDHNPLILDLVEKEDWGPKPFRTIDAWFTNPYFKEIVKKEWKNLGDVAPHKKFLSIKKAIERVEQECIWEY